MKPNKLDAYMRLLDKFVYGLYATQVTVKANWPLVFKKLTS